MLVVRLLILIILMVVSANIYANETIDTLVATFTGKALSCDQKAEDLNIYVKCFADEELQGHLSNYNNFTGQNQDTLNLLGEWAWLYEKSKQRLELLASTETQYAREQGKARRGEASDFQDELFDQMIILSQIQQNLHELYQEKRSCNLPQAEANLRCSQYPDPAPGCAVTEGVRVIEECEAAKDEITGRIEILEATKTSILMQYPLLTHEVFNGDTGKPYINGGLIQELSNGKAPDYREFQTKLTDALSYSRNQIEKQKRKFTKILNTEKLEMECTLGSFGCDTENIEAYLSDMQLIADLDPERGLLYDNNPYTVDSSCRLAQKLYLGKAREVLEGFLIDSALVLTPLAAGRFAALKLVGDGFRAGTTAARARIAGQLAGEGFIIGVETDRVLDKRQECSQFERQFLTSTIPAQKQNMRDRLNQCERELSKLNTGFALGVLGGLGVLGSSVKSLRTIGRDEELIATLRATTDPDEIEQILKNLDREQKIHVLRECAEESFARDRRNLCSGLEQTFRDSPYETLHDLIPPEMAGEQVVVEFNQGRGHLTIRYFKEVDGEMKAFEYDGPSWFMPTRVNESDRIQFGTHYVIDATPEQIEAVHKVATRPSLSLACTRDCRLALEEAELLSPVSLTGEPYHALSVKELAADLTARYGPPEQRTIKAMEEGVTQNSNAARAGYTDEQWQTFGVTELGWMVITPIANTAYAVGGAMAATGTLMVVDPEGRVLRMTMREWDELTSELARSAE